MPTKDFAYRLLDPEDLGLAVSAYVRDEARRHLGLPLVETKNNIVHLLRKLFPGELAASVHTCDGGSSGQMTDDQTKVTCLCCLRLMFSRNRGES